jgi:two-component system chemotaxis response regulator CheB
MEAHDPGESIAVAEREDVSLQSHDIFVIGASAGAVPSLKVLFGALPEDFPGSIFAVVHISADAVSGLAGVFERAGPLPVVAPEDLTPIAPNRIYIAPPDFHMLLEGERVRIVRGPKENRHRPAIDPLFRSAAWAYGPRVVGAVLTGYLDDGAAGLWAIKSCGGTTVVQDPTDALQPEMPQNALLSNQIDHVVPLHQMAALFVRLARSPIDGARGHAQPESVKTEVGFATLDRDINDMASLGRLSPFTCPACRGALWELQDGGQLRYRCHTGHAFTGDSLLAEQTASIEEGLYSALRAVEEKAAALQRLSQQWFSKYPNMQSEYRARVHELDRAADVLRKLLTNS